MSVCKQVYICEYVNEYRGEYVGAYVYCVEENVGKYIRENVCR